MAYEIYYFLDHRNENPVKKFIYSLPFKEQAKIYSYLRALSIEGPNLKRPMADYLGYDIYELRPWRNRIFYYFHLKEKIILLHAIRKRTRKITRGDLRLCHRRKIIIEGFQKLERSEIWK